MKRDICAIRDVVYQISVCIVLSSCCRKALPKHEPKFFRENYKPILMQEFLRDPNQYLGAHISMRGLFDKDLMWNDTEDSRAFYSEFAFVDGHSNKNARKISINLFYFNPLRNVRCPQSCTIFGVCSRFPYNPEAFSWDRIDRIEFGDGTNAYSSFIVEVPAPSN